VALSIVLFAWRFYAQFDRIVINIVIVIMFVYLYIKFLLI